MIITWIAKTLVAINTNTKPLHIGLAMALAFLTAMIPLSLVLIAIFVLAFFLKINQSIFLVFTAVFTLLSPLFLPVINSLGIFLLKQPALYDFFTNLKNAPVLAFSGFDYTAVSGGLFFGIIMFIPVTFLSVILVKLYRKLVRDKIANSKIVKSFQKFPLVSKISKLTNKFYSMYKSVS